MKWKKFILVFVSCFLVSGSILPAQSIKILDSSGLDATELKSLVRSVTAGCSTDQEKMEALWAFITRRPLYHWCEAREGRTATSEYGIVYDPVKAFCVYGTVICYQVADLLANMALEAGIPARTRGFPYRHKVMEAWFEGGWHLF
ncbi:MAG: transglutaminase domain-containing protein, partial [Gemmatimonadota bacterium]|nr:transglutaminase domain-containing protein [Gemmatimonadota bacterium]